MSDVLPAVYVLKRNAVGLGTREGCGGGGPDPSENRRSLYILRVTRIHRRGADSSENRGVI